MPKRNRENLVEQSMYDLLVSMNETLMKQPDNINEMCVMCCFMSSSDAGARCYFVESDSGNHGCYKYDCDKCIADYLNSYPF